MRETQVWSLGQEDPLEKGMANHSSLLAWKIPWTEEPGGLPSMGSHRVGHDWSDLAATTLTYCLTLRVCGCFWIYSIHFNVSHFIFILILYHFTYSLRILQHYYFYLYPLVLCTQRRQLQPTPVLLPGGSHGQRSLVGCSPWGRWESDTTERLHFHFSLSCIGEGNGNPL